MYNRTRFNQTLFNRQSRNSSAGLYVSINSRYAMQVSGLRVVFRLPEIKLTAKNGVSVRPLANRIPLPFVTMASKHYVSAKLCVRVPLGSLSIAMKTTLNIGAAKSTTSETLSLLQLKLLPGSTLIIDTNTLEIFVDGVQNLDAWVAGSVFFQLLQGENQFSIADEVSTRKLDVSVEWSDRYL